jgi:hypothetical protein
MAVVAAAERDEIFAARDLWVISNGRERRERDN